MRGGCSWQLRAAPRPTQGTGGASVGWAAEKASRSVVLGVAAWHAEISKPGVSGLGCLMRSVLLDAEGSVALVLPELLVNDGSSSVAWVTKFACAVESRCENSPHVVAAQLPVPVLSVKFGVAAMAEFAASSPRQTTAAPVNVLICIVKAPFGNSEFESR